MKKITFLLLFTSILCFKGYAQAPSIARNNNIWLLQISKYYLKNGFGLENELHLRLANWGVGKQQVLVRPSVFYVLNDAITFHAGYSLIVTYPYGDQPVAITTPEHNAWAQVTLNHESAGIQFSHRYRLEERWTGKITTVNAAPQLDGYQHRNRFRYRITLKKNLGKSGYLAAFDEMWFNFGENTGLNGHDQNWIYLGYGQKLSDQMSIELGYLHQWIAKPDGIQFESNNTIQLTAHVKLSHEETN